MRKGEKAIRIWAPCPPSKKVIERWRAEGAAPDKEPRIYFRLVPVFDASQIAPLPEYPGEPAPLDPPQESIAGDGLAAKLGPLVEASAAPAPEEAAVPLSESRSVETTGAPVGSGAEASKSSGSSSSGGHEEFGFGG